MNFSSVSLSEPTMWFAFATALLIIDLAIGTSVLVFLTLASFAMVGLSMAFPYMSFAEASSIFSFLSFLSYFVVKKFIKKDKDSDINYANEEMKNRIFKLEQDVSAGVETRVTVNHITFTVVPKSDYYKGCQVMVYEVRSGVLFITSNIPSHEFAAESDAWGDIENPKMHDAHKREVSEGIETSADNSTSGSTSSNSSCCGEGD